MGDRTFVVAGNGRSLACPIKGCIRPEDVIVRTNNFFFEPRFFLGRRVDMAFMAGDPRVAPFMFETLFRCRDDYDLRGWTSHDARVSRAGKRRFHDTFQPMTYRSPQLAGDVAKLNARFGKVPTTGLQAVLMAHGMGAERIILTGIDLYTTAGRYPFTPGRHHRDLMGHDIDRRGMDSRLHDAALDREILKLLLAGGDVDLRRASAKDAFDDLLPLASSRGGPPMSQDRANPPADWAWRSGIYPIHLLKLLRSGRAFLHRDQRHNRKTRP